ncbi:MAG: hypothetical protein K0B08_03895 [Bacteroidales bacterium]|nr:hypothetical protein [Bacteroidales bacterium]
MKVNIINKLYDRLSIWKRKIQHFLQTLLAFIKWFGYHRRVQVLFAVLVISLPLFLIVYGIVLPAKNHKPFPVTSDISSDTVLSGKISLNDDMLASLKNIISLENEKVFQKNRLSLADKDSIYLILDLRDSLLLLEIKGVPVRTNKIIDLSKSRRFSLISHENLLPWISEPFTLERELSTIPKMPIVVKQAPKDTAEAAQTSSTPLPPESTAVFFTFFFDRNLAIEFEQADPLKEEDYPVIKSYRSKKRKESRHSVFQTLKSPRQADQPLLIRIVIDEADARAIYRAVPSRTHLILKL